MRPVNLIPPDEQRGDRSPMRTGAASYVLLAALALGLLGVIAMALTSKQISDREDEKQALQQELDAVTAEANSLRAFSDFHTVQQTRSDTVSSLAQSRFDWERIMRELSLVIPPDVWLVNLTGTASPSVAVGAGGDIPSRDSISGPALELVGCAPSQDAVAGFLAALEDIDGVTRVGIESSEQSDEQSSGVTAGAAQATTDDCRTRSFIYQFEIVVAFDAVPAPPTASASPSVPAPIAPGAEGGQQLAETTAQQSAAQQTTEAQQATNLVPGG